MNNKIQIQVKNNLSDFQRVRTSLSDFYKIHKLDKDAIFTVDLAIEELVKNSLTHGLKDENSHQINLILEKKENEVILTMEDNGIAFNPITQKDPDISESLQQRSIGGLGLFLIKKMADDFQYFNSGGKNFIIVKKKTV